MLCGWSGVRRDKRDPKKKMLKVLLWRLLYLDSAADKNGFQVFKEPPAFD